MDSEIELKLLVASDAEKKIRKQFIPDLNVDVEHESHQLCNAYYDTSEQLLREHGMGLRIRGNNGEYEQTIKCKDGSVGGLHKRAEYNVSLSANNLDIALFEPSIWPEHLSVDELKSRLSSLFTTHFRREQYLLKLSKHDHVEMVFDIGEIETEKHHTQVCEVELELKKGSAEAIFHVAKKLFDIVPFRLGYKSKAQRGYELFEGKDTHSEDISLNFELQRSAQLNDCFLSIAGSLVGRWQMLETRYVEYQKPKDIVELVKTLKILDSCCKLFAENLSVKPLQEVSERLREETSRWEWVTELTAIRELLSKKGFYRKKLSKNDAVMRHLQERQSALLEQHQPLKQLGCKSYIMLQLDILELLTIKACHSHSDDGNDNTNRFAKRTIKEELRQASASFRFAAKEAQWGYLSGYSRLQQIGYIHRLFKTAVGQRTNQHIGTWIDLLEGAEELKTLHFLEAQLRKILVDSKDGLIQWCVSKQESLVSVMELSRKVALNTEEDAYS